MKTHLHGMLTTALQNPHPIFLCLLFATALETIGGLEDNKPWAAVRQSAHRFDTGLQHLPNTYLASTNAKTWYLQFRNRLVHGVHLGSPFQLTKEHAKHLTTVDKDLLFHPPTAIKDLLLIIENDTMQNKTKPFQKKRITPIS